MKLCRPVDAATDGVSVSANGKVFSFVKLAKASVVALAIATIAAVGVVPQGAQAAQRPQIIEVRNDPGGKLSDRVAYLGRLRSSNVEVRILSGYCNSACTMYLGLRNTCVSRSVSFGFHGPMSQFYGVPLPKNEFEYWSGVMASYYPSSVRSWYMRDARYTTLGLKQVSGAELIRLGVRECK